MLKGCSRLCKERKRSLRHTPNHQLETILQISKPINQNITQQEYEIWTAIFQSQIINNKQNKMQATHTNYTWKTPSM